MNTPIDDNVFQNLHMPVARCSASCVNGALQWLVQLVRTQHFMCFFGRAASAKQSGSQVSCCHHCRTRDLIRHDGIYADKRSCSCLRTCVPFSGKQSRTPILLGYGAVASDKETGRQSESIVYECVFGGGDKGHFKLKCLTLQISSALLQPGEFL